MSELKVGDVVRLSAGGRQSSRLFRLRHLSPASVGVVVETEDGHYNRIAIRWFDYPDEMDFWVTDGDHFDFVKEETTCQS